MTFDTTVPEKLKMTQQWFASIITRPIDENSEMMPISPKGMPMTEEAREFIAPSPTLQPAQRIEIYNQQYWWRLLSALHENFPLVTRMFGYHDFNMQLAFPYLVKYPANHWSLNNIGERFPRWIEEEYHAQDKTLVLLSAQVDLAFSDSFVAGELPKISLERLATPGDISSLADQPLQLQPYVVLFRLPYDLFQFRQKFLLQEPEYWLQNDFPKLTHYDRDESGYFVLFRDKFNRIEFKQISQSEFLLLEQFELPTTIDAVCEWLELQSANSEVYQDAGKDLAEWFQNWISLQWLGLKG